MTTDKCLEEKIAIAKEKKKEEEEKEPDTCGRGRRLVMVEGILAWEKELKETEEISRGVFGADIDGSVDKQHQQIRKAVSFASERGVGKPVSIKTIRNEKGGGGERKKGGRTPRSRG